MDSISFDLILVARTMDDGLRIITQNTIDSCINGVRNGSKVNVILVETSGKLCDQYRNVSKMILYEGLFKYNRALNMGLDRAKGDFHILANNDLNFHENWDSIGEIMKLNGYLSCSAMSQDPRQNKFIKGDYAHEGYKIGQQLTGWCIFIDHKLLKIIGRLSEKHDFWYSDDDYAEQLIAHNVKHALIGCVTVDHVHGGSKTLIKLDRLTRQRYTHARR